MAAGYYFGPMPIFDFGIKDIEHDQRKFRAMYELMLCAEIPNSFRPTSLSMERILDLRRFLPLTGAGNEDGDVVALFFEGWLNIIFRFSRFMRYSHHFVTL